MEYRRCYSGVWVISWPAFWDFFGSALTMLGFELYPPVTDQLLNQDMTQDGTGYQLSGDTTIFIVLYYLNGIQFDVKIIGVFIAGGYVYIDGEMFTEEGDSLKSVTRNVSHEDNGQTRNWIVDCELEPGYSTDAEYYFQLSIMGSGRITSCFNDQAEKAVVGDFDSLEDANEQPDIKEDLLNGNGYKANYNGEGVDFTVFFPEGTFGDEDVKHFTVKASLYHSGMRPYTDVPIIGEPDPWFRITGANAVDGSVLDAYVVENGKAINMDTMYGYGYQTVFINEEVTSFIPTFWRADDDAVSVQSIYIDGEEYHAGDVIHFPENSSTLNATFSIVITDSEGNHTKNYNVTFVRQTTGAQLYVAGPTAPDVRSVFLDEYHENKHDIFVANVGDEPLTDLWLDLDATNVTLDDYWTIGGEGNNTLAACPKNFTEELASTQYGELSNVAKIRLVPPEEGKGGEITGSLKIYSGEEGNPEQSKLLATILLSGRAQNPKIVTTELKEAVQYVPYSYMVTTNNMYDWTDVTFTLSGDLPEGVEFIASTGELYGVPAKNTVGEYPVTITAEFTSETYSFESSTVNLILTVKDNTNDNVYSETDDEYNIEKSIGTDVGGHDFVLTEDYGDEVFWSKGELGQFVDLWLNGEKLEEGTDYVAVRGSTQITIRKQTFDKKANHNEINTLAAEFRTTDTESKNNVNNTNELKRTAQNFRIGSLPEDNPVNPNDPNKPVDPINPSDPSEPVNPGVPGNSEGSSDTGSDGNNGDLSNTDNTGSTKGGTDTASQTVTMIAYVVDADGKALADHTVEIHSTVKTGVTDQKGFAAFRSVDFGAHTITVKTPDGNTEAKKNFTLQSGTSLSLSGSTITAKAGNTFTLTLQLNDGELTLLSVQPGDLSASPTTGDTAAPVLWLMLLAVACSGLVILSKRVRHTGRRTEKHR